MSSVLESSAPPSPDVMLLTNSHASSPFELTTTEPTVDQIHDLDVKRTRHSQYYFEDGNIIFQVGDTLYNVHRYFFVRDSAHIRAILQGTDAGEPCVLSGVNCTDFDTFLAILYPTYADIPREYAYNTNIHVSDFRRPTKKTTAQWISVLHLAARWEFGNIKLLAIDNLAATATPIDKIILGRRHGISDWLPGAYEAVCTRRDPLTLDEGMKLGIEDTVRISAARQVYGTCKARYDAERLTGDLGDIFSLEKSSKANSSMDGGDKIINILEGKVMEGRVKYGGDYFSLEELNPNQMMSIIKLQEEKEEANRVIKERDETNRFKKDREEADRVMKEREEANRERGEREEADRIMKIREQEMKEREKAMKEKEKEMKEWEKEMKEWQQAERVIKEREQAEREIKEKRQAEREMKEREKTEQVKIKKERAKQERQERQEKQEQAKRVMKEREEAARFKRASERAERIKNEKEQSEMGQR